MSKFKIGDKLRCVSTDGWCGSKIGVVWTFAGYYNDDEKFIMFKETEHITYANDYVENWELFANSMPELKSGMRIQHRNGSIFVVIKELERAYAKNEFNNLYNFSVENGTYIVDSIDYSNGDWDIVKVFEGATNGRMLDLDYLGKMLWEAENLVKIAKQARQKELQEQLVNIKRELDILSED